MKLVEVAQSDEKLADQIVQAAYYDAIEDFRWFLEDPDVYYKVGLTPEVKEEVLIRKILGTFQALKFKTKAVVTQLKIFTEVHPWYGVQLPSEINITPELRKLIATKANEMWNEIQSDRTKTYQQVRRQLKGQQRIGYGDDYEVPRL